MKQTAVEWQFNELQKVEKAYSKQVIDNIEFIQIKNKILEKAKEMEKEQMIDTSEKYRKKAEKWDELENKIGAFYEDEDSEGDLFDIGEISAMAFGYL